MTLLIHYSDLEEFFSAVASNRDRIHRDKLHATTRWVRGMPEVSVTVEASFTTYDELHRFDQWCGNILHDEIDGAPVRAVAEKLHQRIAALAAGQGLTLLPGRVQLWTETMGKGGAL